MTDPTADGNLHALVDSDEEILYLCGACDAPLERGATTCTHCDTPVAAPEGAAVWSTTSSAPAPTDARAQTPAPDAAPAPRRDVPPPDPTPSASRPAAAAEGVVPPLKSRPAAAGEGVVPPVVAPRPPEEPPAREARRFELPDEQPKAPPTRIIVAVAVVLLIVVAAVVGTMASRNSSTTTTAAVTTTKAPVTTAAPTTTTPSSLAPSTTAATTASSSAVSTAPAAPTTVAATTATTAASAAAKTASFCAAAKVYSMDDVLVLGDHLVADPNGFEAAFNALVANAPSDLAATVQTLDPLTRQALSLVRDGTLSTQAKLQTWLASDANREQLEGWVATQLVLVPKIKQLCG